MALDVICWLWGDKYSERDVHRLASQVHKHLSTPHRFHVFTDNFHGDPPVNGDIRIIPDADKALCNRSCFCRLRMFDPEWQKQNRFDGTILSLDLDLVVTGALDPIFVPNLHKDFMILCGVNAVNPNPFNGSIMMLRAGAHPEVWTAFSPEAAQAIPHHEFPDDQGWIWHMLPKAQGWATGPQWGVYGFQKPGWPIGYSLPSGARLVAFIGKRKPRMYADLPWVRKHWFEAA